MQMMPTLLRFFIFFFPYHTAEQMSLLYSEEGRMQQQKRLPNDCCLL
jgi:hypothetical protein